MRASVSTLALVVALAPSSCARDDSKTTTKVLATITAPDGRRVELVASKRHAGWEHFGGRRCANGLELRVDGQRHAYVGADAKDCEDARGRLARIEGRVALRAEGSVLAIAAQTTEPMARTETAYAPQGFGVIRGPRPEAPSAETALSLMPPLDDYIDMRLHEREPLLYVANTMESDALASYLAVPSAAGRHAKALSFCVRRCEAPRRVSAALLQANEAVALPALLEGSFECRKQRAEAHGDPEGWGKARDADGLLLEKKPAALASVLVDALRSATHGAPEDLAWLVELARAVDAAPHLLDALAQSPAMGTCVYPRRLGAAARTFPGDLGAVLRELRSPTVEKRLVAIAAEEKAALGARQVARIVLELWGVPPGSAAPALAACQRAALATERDAGPSGVRLGDAGPG